MDPGDLLNTRTLDMRLGKTPVHCSSVYLNACEVSYRYFRAGHTNSEFRHRVFLLDSATSGEDGKMRQEIKTVCLFARLRSRQWGRQSILSENPINVMGSINPIGDNEDGSNKKEIRHLSYVHEIGKFLVSDRRGARRTRIA